MYKQLTSEQRYAIFALLQAKRPRKEIAAIVGISESTLSRELRRNATAKGHYFPWEAHRKAMDRRGRTVTNRRLDPLLVAQIKRWIIESDWSPEQICGVLKGKGLSVSVQTVYDIINADETGELRRHRRHPNFRRRGKARRKPTKATNIPNRTSIHERPPEADGTRFGDYEMDLIVDSYSHAILVLHERKTGFIFMSKLKHGRKARPVAQEVVRLLYAFRRQTRTITTDNGPEFSAHEDITAGLHIRGKEDVTVYFADSYCSWQKGAVENTNKLIRQYIPKCANFNDFTQERINNIAKRLNNRPRKRLGFSTPKREFFKNIVNFALAS